MSDPFSNVDRSCGSQVDIRLPLVGQDVTLVDPQATTTGASTGSMTLPYRFLDRRKGRVDR